MRERVSFQLSGFVSGAQIRLVSARRILRQCPSAPDEIHIECFPCAKDMGFQDLPRRLDR
jgi:hypothetical protein